MQQTFCQSCGKPMQKDSEFGTNNDKSKNEDYCVYCFKDGVFTEDVSMEEMIRISADHMERMGISRDESIHRMNQFFPQLKRWKD